MSNPDFVWSNWFGRDMERNEYCSVVQINVQIESHSEEVERYVQVLIFYFLGRKSRKFNVHKNK